MLEVFDDRAALVELVGPDGTTVDMPTVALDDLTLLRRSGSPRGSGTERLVS